MSMKLSFRKIENITLRLKRTPNIGLCHTVTFNKALIILVLSEGQSIITVLFQFEG